MRPEAKKGMDAIRYMIHERLKARLATESRSLESHLDEDVICAFVEGRLEEKETSPVISHLISCASCRQTTAQLIRLESQFDSQSDSAVPDESSGRVPFLDRLASRLAPSLEEDAVFAYHDPSSEPDQSTDVITESKPGSTDDSD
jgi:hypothetical protein